jgi:hypothetical protein
MPKAGFLIVSLSFILTKVSMEPRRISLMPSQPDNSDLLQSRFPRTLRQHHFQASGNTSTFIFRAANIGSTSQIFDLDSLFLTFNNPDSAVYMNEGNFAKFHQTVISGCLIEL